MARHWFWMLQMNCAGRIARALGHRLRRGALVFCLCIAPVHSSLAQGIQPKVPDVYKLNMLIRTSIIALNHANKTGNYTVLRDLAAPAFQRTNNAAQLGQIFAKLRARNLDLSPILFFQPKLVREPAIDDRGLLRLTGFFETRPEQIEFDMLFQLVDSDWRLFGIAIDVAPPKAAEAKEPAKPAADKSAKREEDKGSAVKPGGKTDRAHAPRPPDLPAPAPRETAAKKDRELPETADTAPKAAKKPPETSFWPF